MSATNKGKEYFVIIFKQLFFPSYDFFSLSLEPSFNPIPNNTQEHIFQFEGLLTSPRFFPSTLIYSPPNNPVMRKQWKDSVIDNPY